MSKRWSEEEVRRFLREESQRQQDAAEAIAQQKRQALDDLIRANAEAQVEEARG